MIMMLASIIKTISTIICGVSLSEVVLIWKIMSAAIEIKSEIKFSVKNLWKSVNMAKLSTNSHFEMIHLSSF